MSDLSESPQSHADLIETAAAWLTALDTGSADVAAFEAWRDADVRHAIAFAEVAMTWRDMDMLRAVPGALPPPVRERVVAEHSSRRHLLRAAASVTIVAVVGGGLAYRASARDMATTKVGERKTVTVMPGISVDLNTDSLISWRGGAQDRLWLERGEIALRLGRNCHLDLMTPGGQFRLGQGAYNARLRGAGCELAVLAGHARGGARTLLSAGDIALAAGGKINVRAHDDADLRRVVAWRHDTLVLTGESLDYALAEINRYLPNKIVIGDPALSRLRLGGTFATTDPNEFLQALRTSFGVRATAGGNGGIVLTRG